MEMEMYLDPGNWLIQEIFLEDLRVPDSTTVPGDAEVKPGKNPYPLKEKAK